MSDSRVAALVCEGQTDVVILRAILEEVWPEIDDIRALQPELDEMDRAKGPAGWTQVKSWCEANAGRLNDVLNPPVGDPIDLLLVVMDMDIAIAAGIADPPKSISGYETKRLRARIQAWITDGPVNLPGAVVLSTPVMAIEAWIIGALFRREGFPERIEDPTNWLVEKRKLRRSKIGSKPWKELHRYRDFALTVAKKLARVRQVCPEANRTVLAIERRRHELR